MRRALLLIVFLLAATQARAGDSHAQCPMMGDKARADHGMGFDQDRITHHFLLKPDGGAIVVETIDAADEASREQIRAHLAHIAAAFGEGDFAIPMFVHEQVPPGSEVMKTKKDRIKYQFEPTKQGGRVLISSRDTAAVAAIHEFLAFQIREHKTGDSTDLQ